MRKTREAIKRFGLRLKYWVSTKPIKIIRSPSELKADAVMRKVLGAHLQSVDDWRAMEIIINPQRLSVRQDELTGSEVHESKQDKVTQWIQIAGTIYDGTRRIHIEFTCRLASYQEGVWEPEAHTFKMDGAQIEHENYQTDRSIESRMLRASSDKPIKADAPGAAKAVAVIGSGPTGVVQRNDSTSEPEDRGDQDRQVG